VRVSGRHLLLADLITIIVAAIIAFIIRYEALWRIGPYIERNWFFFVTLIIVRPAVYYAFGLYNRWWRYASVPELVRIAEAVTVGSVITLALVYGVFAPRTDGGRLFSGAVMLSEWMLNLLAIGSTRLLLRLIQTPAMPTASHLLKDGPLRRVLIMGAGDAGALILREMQNNRSLNYLPVGLLDDDPSKQHARIYGVPVMGTRQDIPHLARIHGIDEIVVAMPTAPGSAIRDVRAICASANIPTKTMPGLYELISGSVSISQIREVRIEDLLRREPVRTDLAAVEGLLANAVVMVTGAGGSIGSELCRQIAVRRPRQILLLGHGENSIYHIWGELAQRYPSMEIVPLIADIRDADRIERLLTQYHPEVIFHAAAHKHVPLMEHNPEEAFTTNVLGTQNLVRAAEQAGTDCFVLISSDKAVNPVNIMGASKSLAEIVVQQAARRSGKRYGAVRFGNVLGSRGSVVPLFERQIAAGGPVTVTHPDMTRFFMTIPEAVQLVLQAAVLGHSGEVFVLDMGEQIRIVDLARDLISLSGLTPGEDIPIVYSGVRPGEKLYEELTGEGEIPVRTAHAKVLQIAHTPLPSEEQLARGLSLILERARNNDTAGVNVALCDLLPTFRPASDLEVPPIPEPADERDRHNGSSGSLFTMHNDPTTAGEALRSHSSGHEAP
jgi:FlaA1/EpsC-like NDP-sugar epimerase